MTLLPEVRAELVATATRQARRTRPRLGLPRWFPRVGSGIAVAIAVSCALLVSAIVLTGVRHHPRIQRSTAPASTISALKAKLAVLRRPQTAADRTFNRYFPPPRRGRRGFIPGFIPGFTRLAATIRVPSLGDVHVLVLVHKDVFLVSHGRVVKTPAGAPAVIAVAMSGGKELNSTGPLDSMELGQPGMIGWGLAPRLIGPGINQNPSLGIALGVVPDGVARVRWTFTGAYFGILNPHTVSVDAQVQHNVAVAAVPPTYGPLAQAAWYTASDQLIASAGGGSQSRKALQQINAVNASREVRVAPLLLSHYSLFNTVAPEELSHVPLSALLGGGGFRLNYWQTRYVPSVTGLDGRGLWITPGSNGFCISDPQASTCGPLRPEDASSLIGIGTANASEQTLSGLVPDGNPTVTLVLRDGSHVIAPVVDHNVFEATVHGQIVAIIHRDAHGRLTRRQIVGEHP